MLKVTTSWDDGDILDIRLANLLEQYGIKGTFYITKEYRDNRLSEDEIRKVGKFHEIGAHTVTHPDLRTLSGEELEKEVKGSKTWLEGILGNEVKMFCYPKGFCSETAVVAVKKAGFIGARTTELGSINSKDRFRMNTTLQVYPFPFRKTDAHGFYWSKILQPYQQRAPKLKELGVPTTSMRTWLSTAKATFDIALQNGGEFHLWGHSWEIEKYGMWSDLKKLLAYISKKEGCEYVTNGELARTIE